MTPFETVDHLTIHKTAWNRFTTSDKNSYNSFMVNRILSMDKDAIDVVNLIQLFNRTTGIIPNQHLYQLYNNILPQKKLYSKYVKKTTDKYNKELVSILKDHLELSSTEVKSYIDRVDKDKIGHILYSLGYDDKSIKKLLK